MLRTRRWPLLWLVTLMSASLFASNLPAHAQAEQPHRPAGDASAAHDPVQPLVKYRAEFFAKYRPVNARDMVERVPGFLLDDGDDQRGFGAAAGNILIDARRPSAKKDRASDILERIPADQVESIELIRDQGRGVDLRGHSVVANVVLRDDIPATTRWEILVRQNLDVSPLTPLASISRSGLWRGIDYNAGVKLRRPASGDQGTEKLVDGLGTLIENRREDRTVSGAEASANLNASTWLGGTLLQFNLEVGVDDQDEQLLSRREPQAPASGPRTELFNDEMDVTQFELGADAERELRAGLIGKAILLFSREDEEATSSQRSADAAGQQTRFRLADSASVDSEAIARAELDWARLPGHDVQINLEAAFNVLDNTFALNEDSGAGLMPVPVPGANARVEEIRWDLQLLETWSKGHFVLDYGIAAERSTLSQSGDSTQERSFSFVKPRGVLTYTPSQEKLTRLRLEREVSQLDFDDFVSAAVFQDDDLALGNPNLRPATTWVAELSHERRFGDIGVVKLTAFHHWISDVLDLLPLTPAFEAPGNIGDGRRWGSELEATLPVHFLSLAGARLEIKARWQDSTVVDPVTLARRVLSSEAGRRRPLPFRGENEYAFTLGFRQDLEPARVAWGWDLRTRAERPLFKVNELDVFDENVELNAFVETTRWWGLKIRLQGNNLLKYSQLRDRTVFVGQRGLSAVDFREQEDSHDGRRIILSLSGTF